MRGKNANGNGSSELQLFRLDTQAAIEKKQGIEDKD